MVRYREAASNSTDGWIPLDREAVSIRRELDQTGDRITDHESRIRSLEHSAQDQAHDLETLPDIEARITMVERGLRLVIWALAALAWKSSPDIAIQILASVSGRSGG